MMEIKFIKTEIDYDKALSRIDVLMDVDRRSTRRLSGSRPNL